MNSSLQRVLKLREVIEITGLSRSTIYAAMARSQFPNQVKLPGVRRVGWYESDIRDWLNSAEH
ncbi:MAG TPA: AlpA family transcriptional regulator [Bacteroidetes bacterium]|nr:AlpA family transcriptional regulator [Bacteroidota bacterium]